MYTAPTSYVNFRLSKNGTMWMRISDYIGLADADASVVEKRLIALKDNSVFLESADDLTFDHTKNGNVVYLKPDGISDERSFILIPPALYIKWLSEDSSHFGSIIYQIMKVYLGILVREYTKSFKMWFKNLFN